MYEHWLNQVTTNLSPNSTSSTSVPPAPLPPADEAVTVSHVSVSHSATSLVEESIIAAQRRIAEVWILTHRAGLWTARYVYILYV